MISPRHLRLLPALAVAAALAACGSDGGQGDRAQSPPLHNEAPDGGSVATAGDGEGEDREGNGDAAAGDAAAAGTGGDPGAGDGSRTVFDPGTPPDTVENPPPAPVALPDSTSLPRFPRPDAIRGVYLNAWASGSSRKLAQFVDLARRTEVNTFVMDMKDATGYVSYASGVPAVREVGALEEIRIRDLPGKLRLLESEGIYPVARIVIVKDPLLIRARPELAIQDTAGGVWVDSKELVWLNLYNREVWDYHVALAEELVRLGFPEIQWDYVRFPDAPASDMARALFPGDTVGPRAEQVGAFLGYARERLRKVNPDVRVTADVFGVTTTFRRDVGIGQVWEHFIDQVDAALPMVYPSHYWEGSHGYDEPNSHPYEIVREAMEDAVRRSAAVEGAGEIIPWIQDFTLGPPRYEAAEVRAQIQGAYDAGVDQWILWNPGSRYTEEALEPVAGFHLEPLIRVAGEVVTTSEREQALERAALARARIDSVAAAVAARKAESEETPGQDEQDEEGPAEAAEAAPDSVPSLPSDTLPSPEPPRGDS